MKAPFKTPVRIEQTGGEDVLLAADHELICVLDAATPEELAFIVQALNAHEALVQVVNTATHGNGFFMVPEHAVRAAQEALA